MRAADVMRAEVLKVSPGAPLSEAIDIMLQNCLSGLPVVDGRGELVGILTEGDLLRRVEIGTGAGRKGWVRLLLGPSGAGDYVRTHARQVADLMTRLVETVAEDTPLEEIVDLMERKHIKRVPVLRGTQIVGIISRADLVRALRQALEMTATDTGSDDAIRAQLLSDLRSQAWFSPLDITCDVRDGVVTLRGTISDEHVRAALRVAAANVAGVKEVRDELVWVEPAAPGLVF